MSIYGNIPVSDEMHALLQNLRSQLPALQQKRNEIKEEIKKSKECAAIKPDGRKCRAYAAHGDTRCNRHGGVKTISSICNCSAYSFPHRMNSGVCNYPNEPKKRHCMSSRKSKLRQRKLRTKKWLKEIGYR